MSMSVRAARAPCRHGRTATRRAALTAATTSMIAAKMSRIQAGNHDATVPSPTPAGAGLVRAGAATVVRTGQ